MDMTLQSGTQQLSMMTTSEIRIRDPFIVPDKTTQSYYLFGTTDADPWEGKGEGFLVYQSKDLENWHQPSYAFKPPIDFWADKHFWAPEVHYHQGAWYMLASFKSDDRCRGVHIMKADSVTGPYIPISANPVTPENWECLDGTLYIDRNEKPWIVFSHEWTQIRNGAICCAPLSDDLSHIIDKPQDLFHAADAPWVVSGTGDVVIGEGNNYVTDGPFLFRTSDNKLQMIWSSFSVNGYAIGIAESESGEITGPWLHHSTPLLDIGGHGMIFETFEKETYLSLHSPNTNGDERLKLIKLAL